GGDVGERSDGGGGEAESEAGDGQGSWRAAHGGSFGEQFVPEGTTLTGGICALTHEAPAMPGPRVVSAAGFRRPELGCASHLSAQPRVGARVAPGGRNR